MAMQNTREIFGLWHAGSKQLARLHERDQEFSLSLSPDDAVFEAKSVEDLARVLMENTPGYNTSPECPGWGSIDAGQLRAVRARVTVEAEPVQLPPMIRGKTLEFREIPRPTAMRYAGMKLPEGGGFYFWLLAVETVAEMDVVRAAEGRVAMIDKYSFRRIYRVAEAPEEYVGMLEGRPGALVITSEVGVG